MASTTATENSSICPSQLRHHTSEPRSKVVSVSVTQRSASCTMRPHGSLQICRPQNVLRIWPNLMRSCRRSKGIPAYSSANFCCFKRAVSFVVPRSEDDGRASAFLFLNKPGLWKKAGEHGRAGSSKGRFGVCSGEPGNGSQVAPTAM